MSLLEKFKNTPVKSLFEGAFKREDIRNLTPRGQENTFRSFSYTSEFKSRTMDRVKFSELQAELKKQESVKPNTSQGEAKEDISYRYEKMQDFYKSQVARLTEEVSHYKGLYHKLLAKQSSNRRY